MKSEDDIKRDEACQQADAESVQKMKDRAAKRKEEAAKKRAERANETFDDE